MQQRSPQLILGWVTTEESSFRCQLLDMQPTIHLESNAGFRRGKIQLYAPNVLWVAFSIPSGSLLLVNHLVYLSEIITV
jgi:hypothetical protein